MNKQEIIIITLAAALVLFSAYIVFDKLAESRQKEMSEIYQKGYEQGIKDSVTTLYEQTQNCQTLTITLENLTKNLFDLACLQNNKTLSP